MGTLLLITQIFKGRLPGLFNRGSRKPEGFPGLSTGNSRIARPKQGWLFCGISFISLVLTGCGMTSSMVRSSPLQLREVKNLVVYFGGTGHLKQLSKFDLIMIDPDAYTAKDVLALKARGKIVIGYLSVGEAENYRWFFSRVNPEWIRKENPNWPGNFYVDVNQPGWHRLLLNTVIPAILEKGFDGLYLDTVDTAGPYNFPEMEPGMVTLIKEIRKTFPGEILIAANANFIIEKISSSLDALAVEDLFSHYDHEENFYKKTARSVREPLIRELLSIRKKYKLPIFTIDYAGPTDRSLIKYAYRSSSSYGFIPYVGTVALDRILFR